MALAGLPCWAEAARLALVIGNDSYTALRPLVNAAKDARDVAAELRAAGFEVPDKWVVQNGNRRRMDAALQDFLARIGDGDEVVFYYSGHGVELDNQAALVPVDLSDPSRRPLDNSLRPLNEIDLAKRQVLEESITLNRVATDIAARQVKFSLLIVDACRDNPVLDLLKRAHAANPLKNAGPAPATGLIADQAADTQVLLFSASRGQQSLDRLGDNDPERNGVFTRVLLKAMRTPGLGLRDMLPRIKGEVRSLAASVRIDGRPHLQEPRTMAAYDAPNFFFKQNMDTDCSAPVVSQRRMALVIGNGRYRQINALANPARDGRAVEAALKGVGFSVLSGFDLDLMQTQQLVSRFMAQLKPGDAALIYFAGHGITAYGQSLLLPVDFDSAYTEDSATARSKALSIEADLVVALKERGVKFSILVINAGLDVPSLGNNSRSLGCGQSQPSSAEGLMVVYVTSARQAINHGGQGANASFTTLFLNAIRTPNIPLRQVLINLKMKLAGLETLAVYDDSTGEFYFSVQ